MQQRDDLRNKLIVYLQDACAMEHQLVQVLEGQVKDTADYPQIQARVQQHLEETRLHEQRMEQRLAAYNEKPSGAKSVGASLTGNLLGALAAGRSDSLAKTARDDYMAEHMEIAAYELLIATADLCGDQETVVAAQANLRDELRMANWLEQHLPDTVVYSFQKEQIPLNESEIPTLRQSVLNSLQQARAGLEYASGMDVNPIDVARTSTPPNPM